MIMAAGFAKIRVLDPHSAVSTTLLGATAVYPLATLKSVIESFPPQLKIVAPDAGATPRVAHLMAALGMTDRLMVVQGVKHREPSTGRLSGFGLINGSVVGGMNCLIVDDLCDGGGTFVGLAEVLRAHGAKHVALFVTHGVFTKGGVLAGVDEIFTPDSYRRVPDVTCFQVSMK
jgi:ribose-phosphate pyrophosphokinase